MSDARGRTASRVAIGAWLALQISILCWPLGPDGAGPLTTAFAFLPLLLPLRGLARGNRRTQSWAPLALAPALAMALTEVLVHPPARLRMAVTLTLILAAFAAIVAALRAAPRA